MNNVSLKYNQLVESISDDLKDLRKVCNVENIKTDPKLLKLVVNKVDDYVGRHNDLEVNKNNIILDVIQNLFHITHEDKCIILQKLRHLGTSPTNENKETKKSSCLHDFCRYICCVEML